MIELTETIIVTVLAGDTYNTEPAPQNSVTLSLEDDSPYSPAWIASHPGLTPETAVPLEDSDHDGIPTLLEYLTDHDPGAPDGASLLSVKLQSFVDPADGIGKTFAAIRCIRRLDAAGILLVLETSDNLEAGSWVPGGVFISATPVEGAETEELLYRSELPVSDAGVTMGRFFRLRATSP